MIRIYKKIVLLGMIFLTNAFAMHTEETILGITLENPEKKVQIHSYYYPNVQAAKDGPYGQAIAYTYFTQQLPNTKIANIILFKDACKYWTKGGNLPEAGRVIPVLKEYTHQVITRAFENRKPILSNLYIGQELFQASEAINTKICADQEQLKKWKELQPLIETFSKEYIESRNGYLGHDL
jgi:hypothetical protein